MTPGLVLNLNDAYSSYFLTEKSQLDFQATYIKHTAVYFQMFLARVLPLNRFYSSQITAALDLN